MNRYQSQLSRVVFVAGTVHSSHHQRVQILQGGAPPAKRITQIFMTRGKKNTAKEIVASLLAGR